MCDCHVTSRSPSSDSEDEEIPFVLPAEKEEKSNRLEIHPEHSLLHLPLRETTLLEPNSCERKEIPNSNPPLTFLSHLKIKNK